MNNDVILDLDLPLKEFRKGKVRNVYDLDDKLLLVASDRISAFDSVMPNGIPDKGKVLTQISLFWFEFTKDIVPNHVIASEIEDYPTEILKYSQQLEKRSILGKKAKGIPIECIVRGYLSGSGWKEYQKSGTVCGIKLPEGLKESDQLPEPIFTPSTKAETGHDVNISQKEAANIVGQEVADFLKEKSLAIYNKCRQYADTKGIIIADTKFEFGQLDNEIIVIDEMLTPDSSRFWPKETYKPGGSQFSYDKQFVRDYLLSINWDKEPPAPALSEEVVAKTREKYLEAFKRLTGKETL